MTTTATAAQDSKALTLLNTPGAITLHHGRGVARVYTVVSDSGSIYETTDATCTCPAGRCGRPCYHVRAVQLLHAGTVEATPATDAQEKTDPFALLPQVDDDLRPADHAVAIDTAAQLLGGLKVDTVRRYLTSGRLVRLDGGVSAASVDAYMAARTANNKRTRFQPTGRRKAHPARGGDVVAQALAALAEAPSGETASAALALAAELARLVEQLKDAAKPVAKQHGPGVYGDFDLKLTDGRLIQDSKQVRADYAAWGREVPTTRAAGSWKATRRFI